MSRKNRRLRNILINSPFQAKVMLLVAGIVVMQGVLTVGYLSYSFNSFLSTSPEYFAQSTVAMDAFQELRVQVITSIAVASIEFFIFAIVLSLFFSHRLAGPLFAIKRGINNLLDGVEHHTVSLRKGDEFHDLAERINTLFSDYHVIPKETPEESPED